ncbi:DUF4129 domain-containing protein [Chloroflexi bacterium TSY]|nr:DUF4129 domain-containing protein [Chloroflexi bacterium TSY]
MLLSNRRLRLLYICLAGMEVAWFLPFALLLIHRWQDEMNAVAAGVTQRLNALIVLPPGLIALMFWALLLIYILVADLINQRLILSPGRELLLVAAMFITTSLTIRLSLYPTINVFDFGWIGRSFSAVFNFTDGTRPELVIILLNLFLWLRVVLATDRDLSFFSVGLSFRLGMLLALLGNGLLVALADRSTNWAIQSLWIFFGFGLIAVAIARVDEKALIGDTSSGRLMPWSRLTQILIAVLIVLGVGVGITALITPEVVRTFLAFFSPLWSAIVNLFVYFIFVVAWLLTPLINWLVEFLRGQELFINPETSTGEGEIERAPMEDFLSLSERLAQNDLLRFALVALVIMGVIGLLWLFYARTQRQNRTDEDEELGVGEVDLGGNALRRSLEQLRNLASLMRRFGLSNQLLDAITIENMYANLSRLARQRGYPRRINQPPDQYLPELVKAFPAEPGRLARLTDAYMRVHYGDRPVTGRELKLLRQDYEQVKETEIHKI